MTLHKGEPNVVCGEISLRIYRSHLKIWIYFDGDRAGDYTIAMGLLSVFNLKPANSAVTNLHFQIAKCVEIREEIFNYDIACTKIFNRKIGESSGRISY